jgi:hypothetical protein
VLGDISEPELRSAVDEAQRRLRAGESELAIHPRCGTNLAVAGVLSGLAASMASQLRPRQNRYSYAILASLAALMAAPRLGASVQRHVTTSAQLADLEVISVERRRFMGMRGFWVRTRST